MGDSIETSRLRFREAVVFLVLCALFTGGAVFVWVSPDTSVVKAVKAAGAAVGSDLPTAAQQAAKNAAAKAKSAHATTTSSAAKHPVAVVTRTIVEHTEVVKVVPVYESSTHHAGGSPSPTPTKSTAPVTPAVVIPAKSTLVAPSFRYDGVSTPQAPYDWKDLEIFDSAAKTQPNLLSWYVGWDQAYNPTTVAATWARGMLPMITWEPRPSQTPTGPGTNAGVNPDYTLASIIDGSHDAYITQWAQAAAAQGDPIVLRFAHEMNGNWFPWSEQTNGNSAGQYVAAWQHVHDIFTKAGATNVIWLWSPNIDTWCGVCSKTHSTPMAELYPGASYVDWVGLTGYYRTTYTNADGSLKAATFDNTFGGSVSELEAAAPGKQVLLSEIGATEVGGQKEAWIQSVFAAIAADPNLIGLVWFDHSFDGNDWRIESSPAASDAWAAGVADSGGDFGSAFDVTAPVTAPRATSSPPISPPTTPATPPSPTPSASAVSSAPPKPTVSGAIPTATSSSAGRRA